MQVEKKVTMPPPEMPMAPIAPAITSGRGLQVVDQAQAVVDTQTDHRAAQVEGQHGGMVAGGSWNFLSQLAIYVSKIGLALAKTGDLRRGYQETPVR